MSRAGLASFLAAHPVVIEVTVIQLQGSGPREAGATMLVGNQARFGTIGGGQLEFMAIDQARMLLSRGGLDAGMSVPLGPEIGQCCGGHVRLRLRRREAAYFPELLEQEAQARALDPHLYIFGAGHVGLALARAAALLPLKTHLIDSRPQELEEAPQGVESRLSVLPEAEIRRAPPQSAFVILTHDHALDFLLTLEVLERRDAAYIGMIGSRTKRAKFENFLRKRDQAALAPDLICPIGDFGSLDKRPSVIAACVAAEVIACLTKVAPQRVLPARRRSDAA